MCDTSMSLCFNSLMLYILNEDQNFTFIIFCLSALNSQLRRLVSVDKGLGVIQDLSPNQLVATWQTSGGICIPDAKKLC